MAASSLTLALRPLLAHMEREASPQTIDRVNDAFQLATEVYRDRRHWTGMSFMEHTLTILERFLPYQPDEDAIIACLLIHVLETKTVGIEEIEERFGTVVRSIVSGIHLLSHVTMESRRMTLDNMRLMFLRVSDDLRIVLILLLKRELAMEHLDKLSLEERRRLMRDVLQLFAPVAARLGMYGIKHKLEGAAFPVAYPTDAQNINEQLERLRHLHGDFLPRVCAELKSALAEQGIEARVEGRQKQPFSLFRKLQSKGITKVDQLFDLFAIRVIVADEPTCYRALGVLHHVGRPVQNRFKDYLAFAKPNGYRSLHTTMAKLPGMPEGLLAEVQIRTEAMHRTAEYGVAAHWSYKEGGGQQHMLQRLELSKALAGAHLQDQTSRGPLVPSEHIFVLTPLGDVIELPEGATPLDFAFHVHTDVGLSFRAARINGAIVPLQHELENGDVVEILKYKEPQPSPKWLSLLKTASARSRLKHFLAERQRPLLIARGRELFNDELQRRKLPPLDSDLSILRRFDDVILPMTGREDLLVKVGQNSQNAASLFPHLLELPEEVRRLEPSVTKAKVRTEKGKTKVMLEGDLSMPTRFARCCKADEKQTKDLVGIVSRSGEVRIHAKACKMLKSGNPERRIKAWWA